jgi:hypothetical protein
MADSLTTRTDKALANVLTHDANPPVHGATIFDTALVAAIYRKNTMKGTVEHIFPEALGYVLARQQADGGWASEFENFDVGCILNSMAGLFALLKGQRYATASIKTARQRVTCAEQYLRRAFDKWAPQDTSVSPGQLRLVAELVKRLQECGIVLHFPKWKEFEETSRIRGRGDIPGNHVLVAIVPQNNGYNVEVQPHSARDCGVCCSPAETALCLIDAETYNEDYEHYIRVAMQATRTAGGVPAVFPMSLVEAASVSTHPFANVAQD